MPTSRLRDRVRELAEEVPSEELGVLLHELVDELDSATRRADDAEQEKDRAEWDLADASHMAEGLQRELDDLRERLRDVHRGVITIDEVLTEVL